MLVSSVLLHVITSTHLANIFAHYFKYYNDLFVEVKLMKKAEMQVVLLESEIVTTSGDTCGCFEYGVINPDSTNDEC